MAGRFTSINKIFNDARNSNTVASAFKFAGMPALRKSRRIATPNRAGLPAAKVVSRGKRRVAGAAGVLGLNALIGPNGNRDRKRGF